MNPGALSLVVIDTLEAADTIRWHSQHCGVIVTVIVVVVEALVIVDTSVVTSIL